MVNLSFPEKQETYRLKQPTKVTELPISGTNLINWFRLLRDNKFKISLRYLPRAIFVSFVALLTAPFAVYEKLRYRNKIKNTEITKPPVFIIGHWRSGTTYLHNLLSKDQNFTYVNNMQAFMPSIFISGGKLFKPILKRILPKKRRMDNMELGVTEPQEEEYAMVNLSNMSLYHGMVFPRNLKYYSKYCSIDNLPPKTVKRWKKVFKRFLQKITLYSGGKQLVLKNPSNTFRVKLLLEMFPNAKFIHLYRNPYDVFPSTLKLYDTMFPYFFMQEPFTEQESTDFIIDLYVEMFIKYFEEKDLIPEGNLIEVKYEDLVDDPMKGLHEIYKNLDLENFDNSRKNFQKHLDSIKNYKKNEHKLDDTIIQRISTKWKLTFDTWGYNRIERASKRIERKGMKIEKRSEKRKD